MHSSNQPQYDKKKSEEPSAEDSDSTGGDLQQNLRRLKASVSVPAEMLAQSFYSHEAFLSAAQPKTLLRGASPNPTKDTQPKNLNLIEDYEPMRIPEQTGNCINDKINAAITQSIFGDSLPQQPVARPISKPPAALSLSASSTKASGQTPLHTLTNAAPMTRAQSAAVLPSKTKTNLSHSTSTLNMAGLQQPEKALMHSSPGIYAAIPKIPSERLLASGETRLPSVTSALQQNEEHISELSETSFHPIEPAISPGPLRYKPIHELKMLNDKAVKQCVKKRYHLLTTTAIPKSLHAYYPKTYLLVKEKDKPWEIYYISEKKQMQCIPISEFTHLEKILGTNNIHELTTKDIVSIEESINKYRIKAGFENAQKELKLKFFKPCKPDKPHISVFEAQLYGFYDVIDAQMPKAEVRVDAAKILGMNSDAIKNYKCLKEDPLIEAELNDGVITLGVDTIEKKNPASKEKVLISGYLKIAEMEALDKSIGEKLDEPVDLSNPNKIKGYPDGAIVGKITISENPKKIIDVTAKMLRNFRTKKRLAIQIATSYGFEENDLTKNNCSKRRRMDLDMSLHSIACEYKEGKYLLGVDSKYRAQGPEKYPITARDIDSLPILTDAKMFYFPGNSPNWVSKGTDRDGNGYTDAENETFKLLAQDPVFKYYKFRTLLKFILTDENIYQNIENEMYHANKLPHEANKPPLGTRMLKYVAYRISEMRRVLLTMDSFNEFLNVHGAQAIEEIQNEFKERNQKFARKPHYKKQHIDTQAVLKNYEQIHKEADLAARQRAQPLTVRV